MHDISQPLNRLTHILDDLQAIDLLVIDIREQTTVSDFMLICTARSSRHVRSMASQVMTDMKAFGLSTLNVTGLESPDWALIDFGDFIVNIMQAETRAFYNLEGLWLKESQNNHYVKNNAH